MCEKLVNLFEFREPQGGVLELDETAPESMGGTALELEYGHGR